MAEMTRVPDHRRCAFPYDDGEQCVWEGSKEMCDAHRVIQSSRDRKQAKRDREKARMLRQVVLGGGHGRA